MLHNIGQEDVILGPLWLQNHNPDVDWSKGSLTITADETVKLDSEPGKEGVLYQQVKGNQMERRQWKKQGITDSASDQVWVAASLTYSQDIAIKEAAKKKPKTFEEMVPKHYRAYSKVFSEQESERLPEHQPWDHTIDLQPNAPETIRSKVYPMSLNEQEELDKFIADQLRKGYIVPSKSPLASPVFFIKKKDGKLCLVQDYRKLNAITVKNCYPLPLASDIINRLKDARYFTKFDV